MDTGILDRLVEAMIRLYQQDDVARQQLHDAYDVRFTDPDTAIDLYIEAHERGPETFDASDVAFWVAGTHAVDQTDLLVLLEDCPIEFDDDGEVRVSPSST